MTAVHVVHVVYSFDVGGLQNGIVNLINNMPEGRFRHTIVSLTTCTDFKGRIRRGAVECIALQKPPGHSPATHVAMYRLLRRLRPDVVHTRNLAALECQAAAALASVPARVHGEHGRDVDDLKGDNRRYRWLRRAFSPFVHHYIALSVDLKDYLERRVGIAPRRISQIYNGVDSARFQPAPGGRETLPPPGFAPPGTFVVGTVGRMMGVKDPLNLVRAIVQLVRRRPALRTILRLVMVGDGPLRAEVMAALGEAELLGQCWLAGESDDIPALLRGLDLFVLPSLAEGISNTILEAMSCGLPVIATAVGGNPELVLPDQTGVLVPPADPAAIATAIERYIDQPGLCEVQGREARGLVETRYSMNAMVNAYMDVYRRVLPLPLSVPRRPQGSR